MAHHERRLLDIAELRFLKGRLDEGIALLFN